MDPVSALGLVVNIVQLIEVTAKLVKESNEFIKLSENELASNLELHSHAQGLKDASERILSTQLKAQHLSSEEISVQQATLQCTTASNELISLLQKFQVPSKVNGAASKWRKGWAVVRSYSKRKDVESLVARVERARQGLTTSLLTIIRRDQTVNFEEIKQLLDKKELSTVQATLSSSAAVKQAITDQGHAIESAHQENIARHEQQCDTTATVLDNVVKHRETTTKQNATLNARQKEHEEKIQADSILEELEFSGLHSRRDDIPRAGSQTFRWTITEENSALRKWLRNGDGIFWIRGKPGSGKSTLMKFLTERKETRVLLETWAGDNRLVIGEHYFWYSGTALQKSHHGLLRGLLHEILTQDPQGKPLSQAAFSSRLATAVLSPDGLTNRATLLTCDRALDGDKTPLQKQSQEDLMRALVNVCSLPGFKTCLFVDGLDEYYPHDHHSHLVKDLQVLAELPNVKLCISSRPWQIFQEHFSRDGQLIVLEDLTRNDISAHVWDGLIEAEYQADCGSTDFSSKTKATSDLVQMIVERAEGVFLWVHLVLRALRERIKGGCPLQTLRKYTEDFPRELNDYFRQLVYDRISPTWRDHSETACALKMAALQSESGDFVTVDRSFLDYWLLREHDCFHDAEFFKKQAFEACTNDELDLRIQTTRKFLDMSCRDLLGISKGSGVLLFSKGSLHVEFMHRTVYDFVMTAEMQQLIDAKIPQHFHDPLFLCKMAIARFKIFPLDVPDLCYYHVQAITKLWCSLDMSKNAPQDLYCQAETIALHQLQNYYPPECGMHCNTGPVTVAPRGVRILRELLNLMAKKKYFKYEQALQQRIQLHSDGKTIAS